MPKLRILYDVEGWALHNRALALQKYAPPEYNVTIAPYRTEQDEIADLGADPPDIVFCLSARGAEAIGAQIAERGWPTKLVVSWSMGWPENLTLFYDAYRASDFLVVNHRDYWEKLGRLPNTTVVPNGVDETIFCAETPVAARAPKVVWTGAAMAFRRKSYYDLILPLGDALSQRGIAHDFLYIDSYGSDKRSPQDMAVWYNDATILVCASRAEGTPNPCLEAAACGCTLVTTPVGNMPDLVRDDVNGYFVEPTVESLLDGVERAVANYPRLAERMLSDIRPWFYSARAKEFFDTFDAVLSGGPETRPAAPKSSQSDLSQSVTIFITTVGAASLAACRDHLAQQDAAAPIITIENKAPLSAAFQEMIERCETPYYVQVDEDMLLYPHAVRTLYETISSADGDVAMYVANLFDVHLARCIWGVKIFRHDIVKKFPIENVEDSETEQVARITAAGYRFLSEPNDKTMTQEHALGLHAPFWTPETIFERYATLQRKRRRDPVRRRWVDDCAADFLDRFLRSHLSPAPFRDSKMPEHLRQRMIDQSRLELYALFGVIAGALAELDDRGDEKDYRRYADLPGLAHLRAFVDEVSGSADE